MINEKVAGLLNEQVNMELFSSYLYLEIANFFIDEGLDGFGNWFNIQAQEEIDHARIIINYLQDNNKSLKLKAIDNPSRDYKNHMEALEEVLSHEKLITSSIHDIYELAMDEKDYRSKQFLDWFVEEQNEEETNAMELISKYEMFGDEKKGLYLLDQELGARVHTTPSPLLEE